MVHAITHSLTLTGTRHVPRRAGGGGMRLVGEREDLELVGVGRKKNSLGPRLDLE